MINLPYKLVKTHILCDRISFFSDEKCLDLGGLDQFSIKPCQIVSCNHKSICNKLARENILGYLNNYFCAPGVFFTAQKGENGENS